MRDHNFIRADGTRIPVAQMTNEEIRDILVEGDVHIDCSDGAPNDAPMWILERLRIELLIRELKL